MNMKEPTCYSLANKTYSSSDLTIIFPCIFIEFKWEIIKNLYGNNHFLIILKMRKENKSLPQASQWKVGAADWEKSRKLTSCILWADISSLAIDSAVTNFTTFLVDAASSASTCLSKVSGGTRIRHVPLCNDECRDAWGKKKKRGGCCIILPRRRILSTLKR